MKKLIVYFVALLCLLPLAANAQTLTATLTGAAEVPGPGDTDGTGFAILEINGTTIRYNILVAGIATATLAHIHTGASTVAGPVFVTLTETGQLFGTVTATQDQINQILANPSGFYVNVHNAEFAAGAVRGQLTAPAPNQDTVTVAYFPVVAKAAGAVGTNFTTDLRIVNTGTAPASITLEFFAQNAGGQTAPTHTATLTVAPGEQAVINDVVGTSLATAGLGALRVRSTQPVTVAARILNDLRSTGQGTAGFFILQNELSDAKQSGVLPLLSNASAADIGASVGFRTNIGYFNPNTFAVTVTFTARSTQNGGILGTNTVTIPGLSQVQQSAFSLISGTPEASRILTDFYVTYNATAPIFVYGSVVDNKTGDSVYVQ